MIHGEDTRTGWHPPRGILPNGAAARSAPASLVEQVEAVVRAVLAEMFQAADCAGAQTPDSPNLFAGHLLGLRDAERLAEGASEIAIAPGTVVTPMARDHLKHRGVAVRWASYGEMAQVGARGEWGFAIEVDSGLGNALRRDLLVRERETWREVGVDHTDAARWVAESPDRAAIALTPEASVATWRACQTPGVRAATATDPDMVSRACRHLGANLLIIEPVGQSIYSLKQLCATYRRAGLPRVPDGIAVPTAGVATRLPGRAGGGR